MEKPRLRAGRQHQAPSTTEAAYGPEHPTVAISLGNLAAVLRDLGEPAAARPLLDRALTITEAAHGPEHPAVATRLGNLALALQDLGEPAAARPLLERALTITEAAYGPEHPAALPAGRPAGLVRRQLHCPAARARIRRAVAGPAVPAGGRRAPRGGLWEPRYPPAEVTAAVPGVVGNSFML